MTEPVHRTRTVRVFVEALVIGVTQAVVLVALIFALTLALGNKQQELLRQISDASRAQICVAALPLTQEGRSEKAVNARCLIPNGISPLDSNDDGTIEGTS